MFKVSAARTCTFLRNYRLKPRKHSQKYTLQAYLGCVMLSIKYMQLIKPTLCPQLQIMMNKQLLHSGVGRGGGYRARASPPKPTKKQRRNEWSSEKVGYFVKGAPPNQKPAYASVGESSVCGIKGAQIMSPNPQAQLSSGICSNYA